MSETETQPETQPEPEPEPETFGDEGAGPAEEEESAASGAL